MRVQCRRNDSSRSLSHLMMSFLLKLAATESVFSWYMFSDCTHLRRWKSICMPNFDEILNPRLSYSKTHDRQIIHALQQNAVGHRPAPGLKPSLDPAGGLSFPNPQYPHHLKKSCGRPIIVQTQTSMTKLSTVTWSYLVKIILANSFTLMCVLNKSFTYTSFSIRNPRIFALLLEF